MTDSEKMQAYELHISDILKALYSRAKELGENDDIDTFDLGRKQAYDEMIDIIKTRHKIILDVIEDD